MSLNSSKEPKPVPVASRAPPSAPASAPSASPPPAAPAVPLAVWIGAVAVSLAMCLIGVGVGIGVGFAIKGSGGKEKQAAGKEEEIVGKWERINHQNPSRKPDLTHEFFKDGTGVIVDRNSTSAPFKWNIDRKGSEPVLSMFHPNDEFGPSGRICHFTIDGNTFRMWYLGTPKKDGAVFRKAN